MLALSYDSSMKSYSVHILDWLVFLQEAFVVAVLVALVLVVLVLLVVLEI